MNNDVMIYEDKELQETSTCKNFLQVQKEGNREVTRSTPYYNLDMIIWVSCSIRYSS